MFNFVMDYQLDIIGVIFLSFLAVSFLVQMVYYLMYYTKPIGYQKRKNNRMSDTINNNPPVSIIICSRNESQNLLHFLPSVLEQDYPQYEVIVVNDGSTDESEVVLNTFEKKYKHLYNTYIPEGSKYLSRKKLAMTVGIKAAKHDIILFTEACCEPITKDWISQMSRHFTEKRSIVLGFSPLANSKSLSTKFAVYNNLIDGLQYLSLAISNHPYRGVGRNMAYKKSLFFGNKGFSKYMHLQFGEDDLFINQVATKENTIVEIASDSLVKTHLESFSMWKEMRLCQATTQQYYKSGSVAFWRLESWSHFIFIVAFVATMVYGISSFLLFITAVLLFLIRMIVQLFVINKAAQKLAVEKFYYTLPLFDIFLLFFNISISFRRLMRGKKDYTWN